MKKTKENIEETNIIENKPKLKIVIKLTLILLALLLIVFVIFKIVGKKESYKDKATYTTSFFIRNNKGKYALFNEKGKKITEFIYDSVSDFVNNSALVYIEKDGYAVINNKGKNIVSFGDYNYISEYSGLYKVRVNKGYKLLDSKGKTILQDKDISVSSYGEDYPFSVVTANNEIKIISYDAKVIEKFKFDKNAKTPTANHVGEYATVFYNGKNIIFNSKTKKVITTFKNDMHYCVKNVSENEKVLLLNSCTSRYDTNFVEGRMLVVKGKVNDLSKKCDKLQMYDNVVICETSNGKYFVNISGKSAKLGEKIRDRIAYIDDKNYAINNDANNKVTFYKDGKKYKTIKASVASIGKMQKDIYVLFTTNGYEYYNEKGMKLIKETFKYAASFDKNGNAKVGSNGSDYYLINEKGKKISDTYKAITNYEEYYQVSNAKALKGIINKKGKEILPCKYKSVNIKLIKDKYYAIVVDEKNNYYLYDLSKNKQIKKSENFISINDHYIKLSGKKTSYFTFKDKLIYEE